MATRNRKVRRQRGSRTHGWGQITQHRHSGSRGGTGMAGMHKHKWSYTVKYAPDHFGHNEFKPPNRIITRRWLNLADLPNVVRTNPKPGEPIDLGELGFDKLLGQGSVSTPYSLIVPRASGSAIEKIKAAGGSVVVEEHKVSAASGPPKGNGTPSKKNGTGKPAAVSKSGNLNNG